VTGTRPDLAYAVSQVGRYSSAPLNRHWNMVKRILRYVAGTVFWGLQFRREDYLQEVQSESRGEGLVLRGHVDSDWGGDETTSRSTTGYVLWLGTMPVAWKSKLQQKIGMSATEAEVIAASDCCREVVWLRNLLHEMSLLAPGPTIVREDNSGCLLIAKRSTAGGRTKHITLRDRYVQECSTDGTVMLEKIASEENVADIFTKPLERVLFKRHMKKMMNEVNESSSVEGKLLENEAGTEHMKG
jgi:hypothetical protein